MELKEGSKIKYYSYSYKVFSKKRWYISMRWDNFEQSPHVERYDENGSLIEQKYGDYKTQDDVIKIIKTFRRNIGSVNLNHL